MDRPQEGGARIKAHAAMGRTSTVSTAACSAPYALHKKAVEENVPDGCMREDFTEPLDGAQKMIFYFRSMYEACKELLRNARFAGSQYVEADTSMTPMGKRKLGELNRGTMYENCQFRAGAKVSPVPVFLSSDTTVICKKMGGHPIIRE